MSKKNRVGFWSRHYKSACQGQTTFPENFMRMLCERNTVLEIGPGEGRQADILMPLAFEYSIADICQKVLDQPRYSRCRFRMLLDESYSSRVGLNHRDIYIPGGPDCWFRFCIVHCWYVVHHLKHEELADFFRFAARHTAHDGSFVFNYPRVGDSADDPTVTIAKSDAQIAAALGAAGMCVNQTDPISPRNIVVEALHR